MINIEKRLLYYWSKLYAQQIKQGKDYEKLPKTIAILIANFELDQLKNIPKYYTKWQIREEEYHKIILTDRLELYIIELPKTVYDIRKESNKKLLSWMKFLINPESVEVVEMEENEELKKAREVYEDINADEHERYLAELRIKYILDYNSEINYAKKQGIEQGIEKGKKSEKIEIAKKLVAQGFSIEKIIEITGLSKEKIVNLKDLNKKGLL